jgi:hypothetical protein
MQFHVSEICPQCKKPVSVATVEPHPTRSDMALHNYECVDCGAVRTKLIRLQLDKSAA